MEIINKNVIYSDYHKSFIIDTNLCDNIFERFDGDRRDNNICDSFQNTSRVDEGNDDINNKTNDINVPIGIYRYKITNKLTNELYKF